jgi:lipoate-protein ligase B
MLNMKTNFFWSWPYEEALAWMEESRARVLKNPHLVRIGCGSHREKIITLGRRGNTDELSHLSPNFVIKKIDRGGKATAHEPGQIVLYPIVNLAHFGLTIPSFVAISENAMINFLHGLDIRGHRSDLGPGVFVDNAKLGFIGIHVHKDITMHGFSINVLNDIDMFSHFDPCGIKGLLITSAKYHAELDGDLPHYMKLLWKHFCDSFCSYFRRRMLIHSVIIEPKLGSFKSSL